MKPEVHETSMIIILFFVYQRDFSSSRPYFILNLPAVVYQNNHSHTETTILNTYITNTHTHMHAHARLQQLRSELVSLVSHWMCDMIWDVFAAGPRLLDQAADMASATASWQAALCQLPKQSSYTIPSSTKTHTHTLTRSLTHTCTHLLVIEEESRGSYGAVYMAWA